MTARRWPRPSPTTLSTSAHPAHGTSVDEPLRRANAALYTAKSAPA
ncbi:MAG TPA: hypothetical protein VK923_19725 [Euzebyales bacterium]|nr:hypothetical protein [Euzebyales bacterium]